MRVLHITKKYPNALGGDAYYVESLGRYQEGRGEEVFILVPNCKEILFKKNVYRFGLHCSAQEWDRINFKRIVSVSLLFLNFPWWLKKIKPDIIHVHSVELGFVASFWAHFFSVPVVITFHALLFPYKEEAFSKRMIEFLLLKLANFAKIIVVDTESFKYLCKAKFKNVVYLPVGIESNFTKSRLDSLQKDKVRFLFLGRLEKIKGLEYLLEAASLLYIQRDDFEVFIAGDGGLRQKLEKTAQKLGLRSKIKFLGSILGEEKEKLYCSADVFVLPSLREWCPRVVLEAWKNKLALIATATGDIPFICTHLKNAYLIPPQDSKKLYQAMKHLLEDGKLRRYIAEEGKREVANFSCERIGEKIEKIYLEILEENN